MPARQILFVHQNFPAQFPHITAALLQRGDKIAAIGGATAKGIPGVDLRRWKNDRSSTPGLFPVAVRAEADLIRAQAAAVTALQLKRDGFDPDLIIGHPGWGETLHLRDIFPRAQMILFGEFFYRDTGADVGFDAEFEQRTFADTMRTNGKNATLALAYTMADRIICPTAFQAGTFPAALHPSITVLHEGLDLRRARRRPDARLRLPNGRTLTSDVPVITFVNRHFERLRGFHIFMRALPALLDACPTAQVVLIGQQDGSGYGGPAPGNRDWKSYMLEELGDRLDHSRVHFMGTVPHAQMIDAFSISAAHVYYTYPFVLSWSLVEAMACECLILGSDTAPVRDAITPGTDGILNEFFDIPALSTAMIDAVQRPDAFTLLRHAARETALARFEQSTTGVPGWLRTIDEVLG